MILDLTSNNVFILSLNCNPVLSGKHLVINSIIRINQMFNYFLYYVDIDEIPLKKAQVEE